MIIQRKQRTVLLELLLLLLLFLGETVHDTPVLQQFVAFVVLNRTTTLQLAFELWKMSLDLERVSGKHVQRFDAGDVQNWLASSLDRTLGDMLEHRAFSFDILCFADAEHSHVQH